MLSSRHRRCDAGTLSAMIIEIRTYRLRPGSVEAFVEVMRDSALPLLEDFEIDVLSLGASLDPTDTEQPDAYLIRAFADLAAREVAEERFYGSAAWREGPREAVLAPIVDYHTVVLEATAGAAEALRSGTRRPGS